MALSDMKRERDERHRRLNEIDPRDTGLLLKEIALMLSELVHYAKKSDEQNSVF